MPQIFHRSTNTLSRLSLFSVLFLVALFFMHVRYSPRRTQLVVVAGIFWLGIMMLLTLSDYLTRGWLDPRA